MFLANNLNKGGSLGGYQISRSLRFNSADTTYLNRTPASAGNRQIWTWSAWVKRSGVGADQAIFFAGTSGNNNTIRFNTDETMYVFRYDGSITWGLSTTQVFRDPSAWYHIVVAHDSTQATSTNRIKLYVNGTQVTAFTSSTYPSLNLNSDVNNTVDHRIGNNSGSNYFNGYETETYLIDGQALTPSSFGETNAQTGVWQPKAYSGSYGTNGFYLNFSDNSNTTAATLGKDYSGNGNNWTPNNFSVTAGAGNDSLVDSPTSYGTDTGVGGTVRGNYATLNPLYIDSGSASTFSNGNLEVNTTGRKIRSTIAIPANSKTYAEFVATSIPNFTFIGATNGSDEPNMASGNYGYSEYAAGDVIGIAVDTTANTINFYKNGVLFSARQTTITAGTTYFYVVYGQAATPFVANFGQRPFAYTAPSGFKALCTQNLPTPTIGATSATLATQYFNPILYTGDGTTPRSFTGVGFQPDFVWIKKRSAAEGHVLNNSVAGVGSGKTLYSNLTSAQGAFDQYGYLASLNSDGFTTQAGSTDSLLVNASGATYVAWNWKANGSGSTNTAGSITSTVSANTTSGFSVVTYTATGSNATVGHGLGSVPSMIIVKSRTLAGGHWTVYHSALGNTKGMLMNTSDSAYTNSGYWNNTTPTSTVFSIGTDGSVNQSTQNQVAYCFAEVAGYSKFGSYTGNSSTAGPFVYCGFEPAYLLIKNTSSGNWVIKDNKRSTYNVVNKNLFANLSNAETTEYPLDFLSNGFKLNDISADVNASGQTYIFMAFASVPLKYTLAY